MSEAITSHFEDGITEIRMNRGPVNALDLETVGQLVDALETAGRDDETHAVVLTSAMDKVFSAGLDLSIVRGAATEEFRRYLQSLYKRLFDVQYDLGKPSIAMMNGAARGAGITIAISCDMIVASERVELAYPEIDVGIIPGVHFTHLPRVVGRHVAFDLLFTGRKFSAAEAKTLGMVSRLTSPEDLREETFELARILASKPRHAMRIGRNTFMRAADLDYRRNIENVIDSLSSLIEAPETQERLNAVAVGRRKQ